MTVKEKIKAVLETMPDDSTYDEILRELAFERMVVRGLADARQGRVISNEEMERRICSNTFAQHKAGANGEKPAAPQRSCHDAGVRKVFVQGPR